MHFLLCGVSPSVQGQTVSIDRDRPIMVGRSPNADLRIPKAYMSRRHSVLFQRGDELLVRDENSRNGTFVNGTRVTQVEEALKDRDIVQFSEAVFLVEAHAGVLPDAPILVTTSGE